MIRVFFYYHAGCGVEIGHSEWEEGSWETTATAKTDYAYQMDGWRKGVDLGGISEVKEKDLVIG